MLPLFLVLLVAQSALCAPSVNVQVAGINEVARPKDNGKAVSSYLTEGALELLDGGETNVYILTAETILADQANSPDALSQALAVGQTINLIAELASGSPGDACEYAAIINAAASGNRLAQRQALNGYVSRVASNIDTITTLALNPNALRNARGRVSGCSGGGRTYNFEGAWDAVLNSANPYQIGLLNEQYCTARRLYNSFSTLSNNVGAALSAASVLPVAQLERAAIGPLSTFLRVVASGGNPAQAGAQAKQALVQAARNIVL